MYRHLIIPIAILMSAGSEAGSAPRGLNPDFEVTVVCSNDARCTFDHSDVHFSIIIRNVSDLAIRFPLEFLRQAGPYVTLHDNRSDHTETLPAGMRDEALLANLTVVEPGQTVSIPGSISEAQLEAWGGSSVDVTAEIRLSAPLDQTLMFRPIGSAMLRIVGKKVGHAPVQPPMP